MSEHLSLWLLLWLQHATRGSVPYSHRPVVRAEPVSSEAVV